MQLIKDNRTNRIYKTKYPIGNDTLRQLHQLPFIKAGAITEAEDLGRRCIDKWPFIEIIGNVDGRRKGPKNHPWFTWSIVLDGVRPPVTYVKDEDGNLLREVDADHFTGTLFGPESLIKAWRELETGVPKNDDYIYAYVPDHIFHNLSDEEFTNWVEANVAHEYPDE